MVLTVLLQGVQTAATSPPSSSEELFCQHALWGAIEMPLFFSYTNPGKKISVILKT